MKRFKKGKKKSADASDSLKSKISAPVHVEERPHISATQDVPTPRDVSVVSPDRRGYVGQDVEAPGWPLPYAPSAPQPPPKDIAPNPSKDTAMIKPEEVSFSPKSPSRAGPGEGPSTPRKHEGGRPTRPSPLKYELSPVSEEASDQPFAESTTTKGKDRERYESARAEDAQRTREMIQLEKSQKEAGQAFPMSGWSSSSDEGGFKKLVRSAKGMGKRK